MWFYTLLKIQYLQSAYKNVLMFQIWYDRYLVSAWVKSHKYANRLPFEGSKLDEVQELCIKKIELDL